MAADHSLAIRNAIVEKMLADAAIVAVVQTAVYSEQPPANAPWPRVQTGLPLVSSFEATGWSGSEVDLMVHAFAKGPGMDACAALAELVRASLDDQELPLNGKLLIGVDWEDTQYLRDTDEKGAYHAAIRFRCQTADSV